MADSIALMSYDAAVEAGGVHLSMDEERVLNL